MPTEGKAMGENEEELRVVFDFPVRVSTSLPSKELMERVQLEKFRLDYLLRFGALPFDNVRRGQEPPDFVVESDGHPLGLDCAALALGSRRRADAMFTAFMARLAESTDKPFPNLQACDVVLWFRHGRSAPPGRADEAAIGEVVDTLERIEVDRAKIADFAAEVAKNGFPAQFPQGMPIVDKGWFGLQVTPVPGWQARSPIATQLGFNPILHFSVRVDEVHEEIRRLVQSHDNPRTEHLVLSAGPPNRDGMCFRAESFADLVLRERPLKAVPTSHIRRISVHIWITGEIFDIPVTPSDADAA
jgi:hypothetical protein